MTELTEMGKYRDLSDVPEDIRDQVKETLDMITDHLIEVFNGVRSIGEAAEDLTQKLVDAYGGYGILVEQTPPRRFTRKLKRWNERNRKKRLKGLPEKPNPYYGDAFFTVNFPVCTANENRVVQGASQNENTYLKVIIGG